MVRKPLHTCADPDCREGRVFEALGQPHVLNLLFLLVHEQPRPWRFGELKDRLGIAANILTDRLRLLAGLGLVVRTEFVEMPPRVEYHATPDALELDDAFRGFDRWVARRHKVRAPA